MEANNQKMREALEAIVECAKDGCLTIRESAMDKVINALAAPARNCDVGTAKEQQKRFDKMCELMAYKFNLDTCTNCPVGKRGCNGVSCFAVWAQMPYEADESKGGKE